MSDDEFGKLIKKRMRDAWSHEADKFTPWLHDNIGVLGDALGMNLRAKGREVATGGFSLDLLAEDDDERTVVIENQFGCTDHQHLGQLLTYAAGLKADVVVWVTETVHDSHRAAVKWLNRKTFSTTEFYLVKVEVLQIDNSLLAYRFIPVVVANKEQKEVDQQVATTTAACGRYFRQFIRELEGKEEFSLPLARQHRDSTHYRFFSSGVRSWVYAHEFYDGGEGSEAMVYLSFYDERIAEATALYKKLQARKEDIEKIWGISLDWEQWGWHTIGVSRSGSFSDGEDKLAEIREWAVEQTLKLTKAIPKAMLQEIAAEMDAKKPEE